MNQNPPSTGSSNECGFTLLEAVVVIFILVVLSGLVIVATGDVGERGARDTTIASMTRVREVSTGTYYADVGSLPYSIADLLRFRDANPAPAVPRPPPDGTGLGWKGPYLLHSGALYAQDAAKGFTALYGPVLGASTSPVPAVMDAWGKPIILQIPNAVLEEFPASSGQYRVRGKETSPGVFDAVDFQYCRLVSAGPDGVIDTPQLDADATAPATSARYPTKTQCDDDLVLYLRVVDARPD